MNYHGNKNVIKERQIAAARAAPQQKYNNVKQVVDKHWDAPPFNKVDLRNDHTIHTAAFDKQRCMQRL